MGKRILKELKNWTKGEIIFYSIVGVLTLGLVIVPGIVLKYQQPHMIAFGVLAFIAFVLTTKKTFVGYCLMIAMFIWYSFIVYGEQYYSEIFICGLFFLPYLATEILNWFKAINTDTKFTKKSIIIEFIICVVVFGVLLYGSFNLYTVIDNNWEIVSALCTCFTALVLYFSTYKDKMFSWILLTTYLGLMTAAWVLSAAFSNITYAGVLFSFLGMFIVALRQTIIEIMAFVKRMKSLKANANNSNEIEVSEPVEEQPQVEEKQQEVECEEETVETDKTKEETVEVVEAEEIKVEEEREENSTNEKSSSKKSSNRNTNKKSTNKKKK